MTRLPTRRLTVTLMLTASLLVGLLPGVAHACSCAGEGPAEMLANSDAAFLGTLADRSGGLFGLNATWTFEADQWIKGDFGRAVRIKSPSSGAACGFELEPGDEAAIFVRVEGDTLTGGLCSTLDVDTVRAHLRPQPVVKTSPTLLVAAEGSERHLWLFDDLGRLAGASTDARGDYLEDLSLCPGGRTIVELWDGATVVVRRLRTMRAVRTVNGPRNLGRVWCRDADGRRLLGARRNNNTGDWSSVVDLRRLRRPLVSGDWIDVEVVGSHLVAAVGRNETQLRRISLVTANDELLHHAITPPGEANVEASIEGFAISPDQTRVAFEVTHYPTAGEPSSDIFLRDLATRRLLGRRHVASEGAEVSWLDDTTLLFTSYEDEGLVLEPPNLEARHTLPNEVHWPAVLTSTDDLIGMEGPRLTAADLSGKTRVLATIPAEYSSHVLPLPRPLDMQVAVGAMPRPPVEGDGVTLPPAPMPRPISPLVVLGPVATGLVIALAAGFLVVRRRRRSAWP